MKKMTRRIITHVPTGRVLVEGKENPYDDAQDAADTKWLSTMSNPNMVSISFDYSTGSCERVVVINQDVLKGCVFAVEIYEVNDE